MRILLDTDVLVDVALDRMPHAEPAVELLNRLEQKPGEGFVAWHTISNLYYLTVPSRGPSETRGFVVELARFINVAPTNTESLRYAARLHMRDFEDAMQVAAAAACGVHVIATRNVRDFRNAPVRAARPEVLLREL